MKTPKPEPEYIRDAGRMRRVPRHSPFHWIFALLLMTACAGTLWQHGHAGLTLGLLAAIPFFAVLVHVPYRFIGSLTRALLNCVLFGGALGWVCWRIKNTPPDLALLEGLCAASLIFISSGRRKDYFYLFFITLFLLIYGALIPRAAHLYLTCTAVILLLLTAWLSRDSMLAGRPVTRELPSKPFRHWHHAIIQLILSGALFWFIFALMPLRDNDVPGLFETSFLTRRESAMPPEFSRWLRPRKVKISEKGKLPHTGESKIKPTAVGEKGKPADIPANKSPKNIISGGSGASQGQDLVFYAQSPVKLYHLARLYDSYDGTQWKASPKLEQVRIREYHSTVPLRFHSIEQKYTLVKRISSRLYSGFRPTSYSRDETGAGSFLMHRQIRASFYGASLLNQPEMPFSYKVSVDSLIPLQMPERKTPESVEKKTPPQEKSNRGDRRKSAPSVNKPPPDYAWNENIPPKHYLLLPAKKISRRVRQLSAEITAGNLTAYGKALALRDYLRNTYSYKLNAAPVPPGKEPADYFLFELKEGHCEYFACALAVLARAAGLPSRVATGFSPGNFNTLSNLFEVYEYHAHAWAQIYIPQLGWLTMDATPPSAVPSRTLPIGIGQFRDPFDDEWRITPPELTEKAQNFLKTDLREKMRQDGELSKIDSTLVEMVKAQEKIQEKIQNEYHGTLKKIRKSRENGLLFRLKSFWNRTKRVLLKTFEAFHDFIFSFWLLLLSALLLTGAGIKFALFCIAAGKKRSNAVKIQQLRRKAGLLCRKDPRQSVLDIYTALRLSVKSAGYDRGTLELLDFSDHLAAADRRLGESARSIFLLYYKAEYGSGVITQEDAEKAVALFDSISIPE